MKIRKYFRGSGRVLAFVFIASVIWLLFDMAALRISMTDVNSQLLKERVIKERELERKQATKVTHAVKGGFKHPVQRVEYEEKEQVQSLNKVAQAYRRQRKNQQQNEKHFQDHLHVASNNKVAPPGNVTLSPQLHVPRQTRAVVKKAVDLELSETLAESKKVVLDTFTKATVPVHLSNVIKGQRGVQEDKRLLLPTSANNSHAIGKTIENTLDNGDSKAKRQVTGDLNVKSVKQGSHIMASERHITKMPYNPHDIVKEKKADLKREKLDTNLFQSDSNTTRKAKDLRPQQGPESTVKPPVARKPGVHKVRALDATGAPRDAKAVGQFGHPAVVPSDKEGESKRRWVEGYFNVYLSDRIPLDRAIPDTRPRACADGVVHDDLPTTSVIFCFVDEVWSTLLRSVHSVLNRSPPHLLKEIILVDDSSTKDYLKEQLDDYMSKFPKVRIVRLNERQGLIRARLAGAAIAQGEVLTFLDSHIECNVGWLEPLLERVFLDRKKVACPVIEVINDKDMSYVLVDNFQRGIFKWPLVFGWNTLSDEQIKKNNMTVSDPIRCPVMAGGLFSIDKKYFYELGAYDPGLDVWGGENMEISFKIWMCGGEIEIIPCSRVGHIFRGQNPYKFPKDRQKTVERNLARVAEVWLDEYKELFYGHGYHHLLDKNAVDIGNLTEQIALREKLQCQSFKWYLENVYSDLEAPLVKAEGLIFNRGLRKCLAVHDGLSFEICDLSKKSQQFNYTWIRHIRQQDLCISPQGKQPTLALELCHNSKRNLRWFHKTSNSALGEHLLAESLPHHMCLEAGLHSRALQLNECEPNNDLQKWQFTHYYVK